MNRQQQNLQSGPVTHAPLPELRVTSPLGAWLRRYLMLITVLVFAGLAWAAFYTVDVLDLDLSTEGLGGIPMSAPAAAPES